MADNGETKGYEDMTIEELEAEFDRTDGIVTDPAADPVVESAPVEAEPEPADPDPVDEEVAPEAGVAQEAEPPDERELELEEMRLRMEQLTQQRDHERLVAGQNAGRLGHLQKQIEQMAAERSRPAPADDTLDLGDDYQAEPSRRPLPRQPPGLEDVVAELREDQRQRAVADVYSEFLSQVSEDLSRQGVGQSELASEQNSIIEKIAPTLKERFEPFGDISRMAPRSIAKMTRMVLQSAYTDHKLDRVADLRRQAAERKATQVAETKIVKQAASPSGSGGRPAGEPPPKSLDEMTAEEADAALIAEFGEQRGRLRSRR